MGAPTYPRRGEAWIACYICGRDIPASEGIRHYKSRQLVCKFDADEPTHSDYQAWQDRPVEEARVSPQRVEADSSETD